MEPTPPDFRKVAGEGEDGEDPFLRLIGLVDDPEGPDDVAVNHDHYLYGAPKVEP